MASLDWIAVDGYERATEREISMVGMINEITDKPDWHIKAFDPTIMAKWAAEAEAMNFSKPMIDWCMAELCDKAVEFGKTGIVTALDIHYLIAKSDIAVDHQLKDDTTKACEHLREQLDDDWHPGSNSQVLNLVHPSLYPLVYGRTRVLDDKERVELDRTLACCGSGKPLEWIQEVQDQLYVNTHMMASHKFQWLPCEVSFGEDGKPEIISYINNLHPNKYRPIYSIIERLLQKSITVWNKCLRHDIHPQQNFKRIECDTDKYDTPNPGEVLGYNASDEELWKAVHLIAEPEGVGYWMRNDEYLRDECDGYEDYLEWFDAESYNKLTFLECVWKQKRKVIFPEPEPYETAPKPWLRYHRTNQKPSTATEVPEPVVDLGSDFKDQGLQVIVKIAGIELTPEKPTYEGGNWHLEGMANERIIATALYYYDCENVSDSRLHFRAQAEMDPSNFNNEQSDHSGFEQIYGLPKGGLTDEPAIQNLGSVLTKEGRLLAFPNVLQHRVGSLHLVDKSKPGHRRFVALWLVDPYNHVTSTASVPPQQYEWWAEAVLESTRFDERVPPEVAEMIFRQGEEFTMTVEEAKAYRLELMAERTRGVELANERWIEDTYNFCEH